MKICFFGSSLVSSYWNGAATYYRGMLKEIAALGHEVTFLRTGCLRAASAPRHSGSAMGAGFGLSGYG